MSRLKYFELKMRAVVARLGAILLLGRFRRKPPELAGGVRAVLVLRVDERVGNVLLTTPLIERLRAELPTARIDLLVAASKLRIVEGLVGAIPFERRDAFRRPWRLLKLLMTLRGARYDVAIDASHWHTFSTTSALLLAWTGAPIRIAHARGEAARYATDAVPLPTRPEPEVRTKLRLLEPLGIHGGSGRLETRLGEAGRAREAMDGWLAGQGLNDRPLVGLIPGGRKPEHRMPASVFLELGSEAVRLGAAVIVLWGPGEEALAGAVAAECGGRMAPPTDVEELAALMRSCRVVVANDTGPMHLSVATGTPTIGLFVQGDHSRWGHDFAPHAVVPGCDRPIAAVIEEARRALADRLRSS